MPLLFLCLPGALRRPRVRPNRAPFQRGLFVLPLLICLLACPGLGAATGGEPEAAMPPAPQVVRVAVNTDGFPYSYRDTDGSIKGFTHELTLAIAKVMDLRFELVPGDAVSTTGRFLRGEVDVIEIYSRSPERMGHADFSVPYLRMVGAVIVRKDNKDIHGPGDLRGKRVLVHERSVGEAYLLREGFRSEIVLAPSVPEALKKLDAGEGDAALATRLTAMSLARYWNLQHIEPRGESLEAFKADYCYGVRAGNRELLAKINEGLAVLHASGEFDRIYTRWFSFAEDKGYSRQDIMAALLVGLSVALAVAIAFALARRRMLAELRRREELYRGVFESAHEGLLVMEYAEGTRDILLVRQANAAAVRMLALPSVLPEEALLREMLPRDAGLVERLLAAARGEGQPVFEAEHAVAGKGVLHLMVSVSVHGQRVLAVLTDVTAMKQAQEQLGSTR